MRPGDGGLISVANLRPETVTWVVPGHAGWTAHNKHIARQQSLPPSLCFTCLSLSCMLSVVSSWIFPSCIPLWCFSIALAAQSFFYVLLTSVSFVPVFLGGGGINSCFLSSSSPGRILSPHTSIDQGPRWSVTPVTSKITSV